MIMPVATSSLKNNGDAPLLDRKVMQKEYRVSMLKLRTAAPTISAVTLPKCLMFPGIPKDISPSTLNRMPFSSVATPYLLWDVVDCLKALQLKCGKACRSCSYYPMTQRSIARMNILRQMPVSPFPSSRKTRNCRLESLKLMRFVPPINRRCLQYSALKKRRTHSCDQ